jgi:hypothetical protein
MNSDLTKRFFETVSFLQLYHPIIKAKNDAHYKRFEKCLDESLQFIMTMNYKIFDNRHLRSELWEIELKEFLEYMQFVVAQIGVEFILKEKQRIELYKNGDDELIKELRFKPDFFVFRNTPFFPTAYWEAKTQSKPSEKFAIDERVWQLNIEREVKIIYACKHFNGKRYAQWLDNLIGKEIHHPGGAGGSGFPFVLLNRCHFEPLEEFVKTIYQKN